MKLDFPLTAKHLAAWPRYHEKWCERVLSTVLADRERAEDGIRRTYRDGGLAVPTEFTWLTSLLEADKLRLKREKSWRETIGPVPVSWLEDKSLTQIPVNLRLPPLVSRCLSQRAFTDSLVGHYSEIMPGNYGMCCGRRVEEELIAPRAFLFEFCRDPGSANYEPLIAAIDSCGWWWWPFRESVILLERPSEIHRDEQSYLHKTDGPALVFRDGTSSHFWHGLRVDPEALVDDSRLAVSIRRAQLANYVHENEQRRNELIGLFGRDEYEDALQRGRAVRPKVDRESRLFKGPLPTLDALKSHGKPLFLYERYIAGDRRRVWEELVAAGSQVRQDGLAADALAVTVETMTRVRRNVEIVAERLKTLRYRFLGKSFVPARGGAAKKVAQLERAVGPMPLSLRAFYELVGDVDFMGGHKRLNPRGPDADATPDPLVVEPLDYVLSEFERNKADVQYEAQFLISMSPDDLTKQGDSGGFPYSIAIPNLGADGELLNASFHGTFVEYLRLAFEWGGFPGWEGDDGAPMEEINQLREGLLPF